MRTLRSPSRWWLGLLGAVLAVCGLLFATQHLCVQQGGVRLGWGGERGCLYRGERPVPGVDGPYAFRTRTGYLVVAMRRTGKAVRLRTMPLLAQPLPLLEVEVDNLARTRFRVPLREAEAPASAVHPGNPSRLLMLSDIEGEFDKLVALLRAQGVVDQELRWRYGDGHVALAGDLVDRGPHVVPVLWLVYKLEAEARAAGGRVHYLLGNHELQGLAGNMDAWPDRMVATAQVLGSSERLLSAQSVLGQWLRGKPVVVRVGDHLLAHGGISRDFLDAKLSIESANAIAREHLVTRTVLLPAVARPVLGRTGVTRYRGLAIRDGRIEADTAAHLRRVVRRYGVRRVAIGHTLAPDVALEQGGLLLRLDVRHAAQTPQAALYADGRLWRVDADGGKVRLDCGRSNRVAKGRPETGPPSCG